MRQNKKCMVLFCCHQYARWLANTRISFGKMFMIFLCHCHLYNTESYYFSYLFLFCKSEKSENTEVLHQCDISHGFAHFIPSKHISCCIYFPKTEKNYANLVYFWNENCRLIIFLLGKCGRLLFFLYLSPK